MHGESKSLRWKTLEENEYLSAAMRTSRARTRYDYSNGSVNRRGRMTAHHNSGQSSASVEEKFRMLRKPGGSR
ncbi:NAC domain-containing protein [Psidium guajava]|nr:NAC domain-containing protein [Psidium guajava]